MRFGHRPAPRGVTRSDLSWNRPSATGVPLVLALLAACGASPLAPRANVVIVNHGVSAGCATLMDYCVEVTCTVENRGDALGVAEVQVDLFLTDGTVVRRTETIQVEPGGIAVAKGEFKEAKISQATLKYDCSVVRELSL